MTRERPFLQVDASGNYSVFVPAVRRNSSGTTWAGGPTAGTSIPIDQFYVAKPTDDASQLNKALQRGLNLIFTPGVYHLNRKLKVNENRAVVLGLGFPTLIADDGDEAIEVKDVKGVKIAGLIIDAGPVK